MNQKFTLDACRGMAGQVPVIIKSNKDHKLASDSIKYINDSLKNLETHRKKLTQHLLDEKRGIDDEFKKVTVPLSELVAQVKGKMLVYSKKKEAEQLAYEEKMKSDNPESSELIVHDKVSKIKQGEVSSNTVMKTIKYRVSDENLQEIVEIKQLKFKEYLNNNKKPDWIEEYTVESVMVRSK